MSKLVAHVFGKRGCAKCKVLKQRLQKLLDSPAYRGISMEYHDVLTQEGIMSFCRADCLNPNRIPSLMMAMQDDDGRSEYLFEPRHDGISPESFSPGLTYQRVGVQTDYNGDGRGVITPAKIAEVLDRAMELAGIEKTGESGVNDDADEDDGGGFCASCVL